MLMELIFLCKLSIKEYMKIIYKNNGVICVINPTGILPIEEVCRKDVPAGIPYLILENSEIPSNDEDFSKWKPNFSKPSGYGSNYGAGTNKVVVEYDENGFAAVVALENTSEVNGLLVCNHISYETVNDGDKWLRSQQKTLPQ